MSAKKVGEKKSKTSKKPPDETNILQQPIVKIIAALGGGAAIFYAIGFTIVQTYIHKYNLDGMFWITKEFYIDAGSKFFLDMVRSPLLVPYIFLPYLIILYLLIPKRENLREMVSLEKFAFSLKQWIKFLCLMVLMLGTYVFALSYGGILKNEALIKLVHNLIIDPTGVQSAKLQQSFIFFTLVTPMVVALGILIYRFYGLLEPGSESRILYSIACIFYLAFLAIVPITYGLHIYGWKMVPIKEPQIIVNLLSKGETKASLADEIWLLGQFGNKYLFFKTEKAEVKGIIVFIDEEKIDHLDFDPRKSECLTDVMERMARGDSKKQQDKQFLKNAEAILQKSLPFEKGE